jgi:hypothetical protein
MRILLILFGLVPWLTSCSKEQARPTATKAVLVWTNPKLKSPKTDTISKLEEASLLLSAFDGILKDADGTPYDTPFYDLEITFTLPDGREVSTKVYLPRQQVFPGMWKHPQSKALNYFDDQNGETRRLVQVLLPYLPPIYPKTMDFSKSIPFHLGIPDFTEHDVPITGDFPPGTFTRGGNNK